MRCVVRFTAIDSLDSLISPRSLPGGEEVEDLPTSGRQEEAWREGGWHDEPQGTEGTGWGNNGGRFLHGVGCSFPKAQAGACQNDLCTGGQRT